MAPSRGELLHRLEEEAATLQTGMRHHELRSVEPQGVDGHYVDVDDAVGITSDRKSVV